MPNVIAVCGNIGAGKDTVGNWLVSTHAFTQLSFAYPLKRVAMDVFGLEERHVFGTQADKNEELDHVRDAAGYPRTPRKILEHLGTEGFRTIDPDVWVKLAERSVLRCIDERQPVVVTDARFPNEFEMIRRHGGVVWEVVKVGGVEQRTGHASDEAWRNERKDAVLMAKQGDLEALYAQVDMTLAAGGRMHEGLLCG